MIDLLIQKNRRKFLEDQGALDLRHSGHPQYPILHLLATKDKKVVGLERAEFVYSVREILVESR